MPNLPEVPQTGEVAETKRFPLNLLQTRIGKLSAATVVISLGAANIGGIKHEYSLDATCAGGTHLVVDTGQNNDLITKDDDGLDSIQLACMADGNKPPTEIDDSAASNIIPAVRRISRSP
ncbi:MAG TPA: hypothetical protein VF572_00540 [Candidatus Saccharimonadales bacterium]